MIEVAANLYSAEYNAAIESRLDSPLSVALYMEASERTLVMKIHDCHMTITQGREYAVRRVRGIVLSDGYDMRFEAALRTIPGLEHRELRKVAPRLGLKL